MGIVIVFIVGLAGLVGFWLSLGLWGLAITSIKDLEARKKIESRCTTTSLVLGLLIFFIPIDPGPSGSNYTGWLSIAVTKTLLIIFLPSSLAAISAIIHRLLPRNTVPESQRTSYASLAEAIEAQTGGVQAIKKTPPKKQVVQQHRKDNVSRYILAMVFISFSYFGISLFTGHQTQPGEKQSIFTAVALMSLFFSSLAYVIWLLIRPKP